MKTVWVVDGAAVATNPSALRTSETASTQASSLGTPLDEIERTVIRETLLYTKGDKKLAAQLLGIATRTIYRKLDRESSDGSEPEDDDEPPKSRF